MQPPTTRPELTIIVPCFNEQEGLSACHERLSSVLASMVGSGIASYELLYIDDGSRDRTADLLRSLHAQDPAHVVVLRLSRNFGHQIAVTAGLSAARGAAAVIIDADLQDPPELIPEMVRLWRQGYQVVYGVRESREGETGFKLATAKLFYRIINRLSEVEIPLDTGDFRLIDRCVIDAFEQMGERHRLLRGMASWIGYNQIGLRYQRHRRFAGHTKYPLKRMLSLALDGIVSFSTVPLRFVTFIGFSSASLAILGILYSFIVRVFTQHWVQGWAMSFIGMLFMSGMQMLCIGILGEYIGRIYTESKKRPLYFLREVLRGPVAVHTPALESTFPEVV
jgi:glycosyltransferase involved in cell wall biosynthesis